MRTAFIAALILIDNPAKADIYTSLLKAMETRAIEPATTSGRITDLEAVISDPRTNIMRVRQPGLVEVYKRRSKWVPSI